MWDLGELLLLVITVFINIHLGIVDHKTEEQERRIEVLEAEVKRLADK